MRFFVPFILVALLPSLASPTTLLLPAVQAVREAALRTGGVSVVTDWEDTLLAATLGDDDPRADSLREHWTGIGEGGPPFNEPHFLIVTDVKSHSKIQANLEILQNCDLPASFALEYLLYPDGPGGCSVSMYVNDQEIAHDTERRLGIQQSVEPVLESVVNTFVILVGPDSNSAERSARCELFLKGF